MAFGDKLIAIAFSKVDCRVCKSRGVLLHVLLRYHRFSEDYQINDCWYFCPCCCEEYHQYFKATNLEVIEQAEFN